MIERYEGSVVFEAGPHGYGKQVRNRAFLRARSAYIQYLDADDLLLPDKIEADADSWAIPSLSCS